MNSSNLIQGLGDEVDTRYISVDFLQNNQAIELSESGKELLNES